MNKKIVMEYLEKSNNDDKILDIFINRKTYEVEVLSLSKNRLLWLTIFEYYNEHLYFIDSKIITRLKERN